MALAIRLAESRDDREKVYGFRYTVYVEEMGRRQIHADHWRRTIVEPLDEHAKVLVALEDDHVVGTIRINIGSESDLGTYPHLYDMFWVGEHFHNRVSVTTKLMVSPKYRGGTLPVRLASTGYRLAAESRVLFDFIDCNAHLESFFTRLGYRRYRPTVNHCEYGEVLPMVLMLEDTDHLVKVKSPLLRVRKLYQTIPSKTVEQQCLTKSGNLLCGGNYA